VLHVYCRYREHDERSVAGKHHRGGGHHQLASSSSTYALAPVNCPDTQPTDTALTVVPSSPLAGKLACTLPVSPPPPPRTCHYSPATARRHGARLETARRRHGAGLDALTLPATFSDLDVWKTTTPGVHDTACTAALARRPPPPVCVTDADLSAATWQRCRCSAGPPPCVQVSPPPPRRVRPPPQTSPPAMTTFKPSPDAALPITLRPERCAQSPPTCHGMSLHLHVKHHDLPPPPPPDNAAQQPAA